MNKETDTALKLLLDYLDKDQEFKDKPAEIAYVITTAWHETWTPTVPRRFVPCVEMGAKGMSRYDYFEEKYGYLTPKGKELGNTKAGDGYMFSGKGYVMLTGRKNFTHMSEKCGYGDLLITPGREGYATAPDFAYKIMAVGMRDGDFTGHKLSNYYTKDGGYDFLGARDIVNPRGKGKPGDKAKELADHAELVYGLLIAEDGK